MVGRRSRRHGALLGVALVMLVGSAEALAAGQKRLVMVTASTEEAIQALERSYDVGYVGDPTEAAVYIDDREEALLRAAGYTIGETVQDRGDYLERKAETAETTQSEKLASEFARKGLPSRGVMRFGEQVVNLPGDTVIQRAYTFTNYAGRFLYVEAKNKSTTATSGPLMRSSYAGPDGVFRPAVAMSNSSTGNPNNINNNGVGPDGNDCSVATGQGTSCGAAGQQGNKVTDVGQYMYHRQLQPLLGADANLAASEIRIRVAAVAEDGTEASFDEVTPVEWAGSALPPRVANFQKDFITKYLDPTETYARMDQLTAQFPDIMEAIVLPHKTTGYQRQGMAMMAGTTNPVGNPNTANQSLAVQLFSRALGHQGGNDITAEFKNPGVPDSPLSITVTDGTWTEHDPSDTDASDGISQIQVPVKDIVINLATGADGALTSTAAQVVAAINADPAASALVQAFTYAGNAGTGIVPATPSRNYNVPAGTTGTPTFASTKVRLGDGLRGGTVYWTGSATATPPTLARTDARHVQKGPFQPKVYRIGKSRDNSAVGVFLYCQQHAREWVTPLVCLETAERLVRNYAVDPTTKEYVDNLNIFILPSVNPDGGHNAIHENSVQRKNMNNYCAITTTQGGIGNRNAWGVDLNRNNTVGTLFDGYDGASTSCTSEVFTGPFEASEVEIKNEHWIGDTFTNIKFANNIHTHGGYFMWAPGAYIAQGRQTLPAPNIGVERYFFDVSEQVLSHIRSSRGTVILPQRTGPIADVLYSAAGNSADENYYRRGIVAYSFEAGAQRIALNPATGQITKFNVGFQPCFAGPGTNGGQGAGCATNPLIVNEGHDSTLEFAEGNYGLIQGALEYARDTTAPETEIEYSAERAQAPPINYRFSWINEPSVIRYTTDGSTPTMVDCDNPTGSTRCFNNQGPRMPAEVLQITRLGIHDVKWFATDLKGNQSEVQTQRFIIGPEQTVSGTVPATLSLSLGPAASFGPFVPGSMMTYSAGTTANVISTAGDGILTVSDPGANPGHLVNGAFVMPQALRASATSLAGTGGPLATVGGSANPTTLLTYTGPTSNDPVALNFSQSIAATDPLRTGTYSKTLTFTLSTTTP